MWCYIWLWRDRGWDIYRENEKMFEEHFWRDKVLGLHGWPIRSEYLERGRAKYDVSVVILSLIQNTESQYMV